MTRRLGPTLLVITASIAVALAANDAAFKLKPGAKGKNCLTCHANFADTMKLPSVHTPVKNGDCSDCHNPHASKHGKMLAEDPSTICASCHPTILPDKRVSAHPDVVSGNCTKCHDPHGSKNKGNLLRAGNDLCVECHKGLGKAIAEAKFKHAPVAKSCLSCHDPHAGETTPYLLTKKSPQICLDCHKADQPNFVKAHLGYPVGKGDCTSCHDPHGSGQPAILWASVHPPVKSKMCAQCHNDASAPNALQPKKAGIDACRGCHNELVNAAYGQNRIHWPVVDRTACLNCHNPHAAKTAKLLRAEQGKLCGSCHPDAVARQATSATKHQPIADGECSTCHQPHASDTLYLLEGKTTIEVCGKCHDWGKHSAHPMGAKVADPRNKYLATDCLSCHRTHGSPEKHLAHFDTKKELCLQCHAEVGR